MWHKDQIAEACMLAEIPDSKYESLMIELNKMAPSLTILIEQLKEEIRELEEENRYLDRRVSYLDEKVDDLEFTLRYARNN